MADQKQFTPSDILSFRWIRDARLSPDGRHAVYELTRIGPEDRASADESDRNTGEKLKEYSDLYLVRTNGGIPLRLTASDTTDSGPRWSPDGSQIAFSRTADKISQIFTMPVAGGEPVQRTNLPQGASAPVWSPDGAWIAFTAGTDFGKEKPDRAKDPYLVTRSVWRFDAIGDLDLSVSNIHLLNLENGETRQLTDSRTRDTIAGWLPDSGGLVFLAAMKPESFRTIAPELRIVSATGEEKTLLSERWGIVQDAVVEPSGTSVVIVGRPDDGAPIGTSAKLYRVAIDAATAAAPGSDAERGAASCLTPDTYFDPSGSLEGRVPAAIPTRLFVSPDGAHVYCNSQTRGTVGIYQVATTGEPSPTLLVGGDRTCHLLDYQVDQLLVIADDINTTPYLLAAPTAGTAKPARASGAASATGGSETSPPVAEEQVLARANAELFSGMAPLEIVQLEFTGSDGVPVDGWFVKPSGVAELPAPTILWIHGGPHGAQGHRFAFDTWLLATHGYGVMFVNHRASTGYGDEFATAIKGDWGNLDYHDLMAGVDTAIEQGLADPKRLGVCGISGGGNLSCWIVGHTDRFKAAIPQNPVTNWVSFYGVSDIGVWFGREQMGGDPHEIPEVYAKCSPITYAHQCTTPTLLIQNEADWRCPPEQSEQFYTVLRANHCTVQMLRHPASSHGGSVRGPLPVRLSHLRETLSWFDAYVMGRR